jgi:hypothetical protein
MTKTNQTKIQSAYTYKSISNEWKYYIGLNGYEWPLKYQINGIKELIVDSVKYRVEVRNKFSLIISNNNTLECYYDVSYH